MPLTIEFLSSDQAHGYVFIDRDNLIFQFEPKSDSNQDNEDALNKIFSMQALLSRLPKEVLLPFIQQDNPIHPRWNPLHKIVDHISPQDFGKFHLHIKFKNDLDWPTIKRLFEAISPNDLPPCMLSPYRNHILATAYGYFDELENKPSAKVGENYHRQEKKELLAKALNEMMDPTPQLKKEKETARPYLIKTTNSAPRYFFRDNARASLNKKYSPSEVSSALEMVHKYLEPDPTPTPDQMPTHFLNSLRASTISELTSKMMPALFKFFTRPIVNRKDERLVDTLNMESDGEIKTPACSITR